MRLIYPNVRSMFLAGLAVRLIGAGMIWLGDGHQHWFSKAVVLLGVALSIGGIGILRYLLYSGMRKKVPAGR